MRLRSRVAEPSDAATEPVPALTNKRRRRSSARVQEPPVKRARRSATSNEEVVEVVDEDEITEVKGVPDGNETTEVKGVSDGNETTALKKGLDEEHEAENVEAAPAQSVEDATETDVEPGLSDALAAMAAAAAATTVSEDGEEHADVPLQGLADEEDTSSLPMFAQPREWTRIASLPLVDQLADQILDCVGTCTPQQLNKLNSSSEHESSAAWRDWITEFNHTKRLYSREEHYLNSYEPGDAHIAVKKSNLATAILAVLKPQDGDFLRLHKRFMEIFLPAEEPLSDWQADLYYQIKLRLYGYGSRFGEDLRIPLVNELFPEDVESILWRRFPRTTQGELTEPESRLASLCRLMRYHLLPEGSVVSAEQQQEWSDILSSIQLHLKEFARRRVDYLRGQKTGGGGFGLSSMISAQVSGGNDYSNNFGSSGNYEDDFDRDDMVRRAALAAHAALRGASLPDSSSTPLPGEAEQPDASTTSFVGTTQTPNKPTDGTSSGVPSSTSAQYQKARLEATAKAASKARAGANLTPSQRRPWSTEEENALMTGLDRVKGPHWSQILAMYGTGGTVSEVLKDRNQVQLKDKARNLKLFFLKSGHEVPPYLKHVTGELKTRAPAQAARNETMDRLEESGKEDKAAHEAITALAAGPRQHNGFAPANGSSSNWEAQQSSGASRASPSADEAEDETEEQREQRRSENDREMGEAIETALQAIGTLNEAPTTTRTRRGVLA